MHETTGSDYRRRIRACLATSEAAVLADLMERVQLDAAARQAIAATGAEVVERVRSETTPSMMESFLAEYGLSTAEGVGLMCLAEALLRVPDAETIDELIQDKIEPSDWGAHLGHSSSSLVNASTWALMLTGKVLKDDTQKPVAALRGLIRRIGEPLVRTAVGQSMKLLARQFVLGETIEQGLRNAREREREGYTSSYDMLGEAARTDADARRYHAAYAGAIAAIARQAKADVRSSPGISVKLSALHPRYETTHRSTVMAELLPRARELVRQAARAGIGFNIDAEEQDRLELSLDIIEALLDDPQLAGWDGFGVVVQAYGRRAAPVIETLYELAGRLDRRIMVRLVKGAYRDTEIKLAQELGVEQFPVFTRKVSTDVSFMACARMLLERRDRIYPQFATHNAHTCAAVLAMAGDDVESFEFQRLHGMGESLHAIVRDMHGVHCRIYAPVGAHRDLLAYLVRRLLENGANSSFVNQVVDTSITPADIARDPVDELQALGGEASNPAIRRPIDLFAPKRRNSRGFRIQEPASSRPLIAARDAFADARWEARPILASAGSPAGPGRAAPAPAEPDRVVGTVHDATPDEVGYALKAAQEGFAGWSTRPVAERTAILRRVADLYEGNVAELIAIASREAGKTLQDGIAEVREAVDFLRYYAAEADRLEADDPHHPRGVFVCISPWNFPLAIFTGQIAAALAMGNAVLAKPAEQTPLIATRAVELMRQAGLPEAALQLLPGDGPGVGGPLTADPGIAGVCFTGSSEVAQIIHRSLAANAGPEAVLIAETGGLNAMIVDSTALTELVVPMFVVVLVGGWGSVQTEVISVDPSHTAILKGMTFMGMISLLASGLGYFGQPHILARFMALRSERDVPRATLIGMSWMVLALVGAVATGYLGIAYFADAPLADGETVLIELIRALFNPWVAGVLMAAILAAIMSTIDSQLIVSASAITNDFYRGMVRSNAGATELVWISRAAVIAVSVIALYLAMDPEAGVLDLVAYAWGGFGAAFGPVIILSLYWSRMNRNGALAGMVVGALTVIIWEELSGGVFDVYELLPGFIFVTVAIVVVSQLTGRPSVEVAEQFARSQRSTAE